MRVVAITPRHRVLVRATDQESWAHFAQALAQVQRLLGPRGELLPDSVRRGARPGSDLASAAALPGSDTPS